MYLQPTRLNTGGGEGGSWERTVDFVIIYDFVRMFVFVMNTAEIVII
jgi:hypothetical protein